MLARTRKWGWPAAGLFAAALAGCGNDNTLSDDQANAATAAAISAWRMVETSLLANSAALDARAAGPPVKIGGGLPGFATSRPAHEYGMICPELDVARKPTSILVDVTYGTPGCESELTNEQHSGTMELDAPYDQTRGVLTVHDYKTGPYTVNGEIGASYDVYSWILDSHSSTVEGPAGTDTLTACMGISRDAGVDSSTFGDDFWEVEGTATVRTDHGSYDLQVVDGRPLIVLSTCRWPTRGQIMVDLPDGGPTAIVDFGSGYCDDEVMVAVNGRETSVSLPGLPIDSTRFPLVTWGPSFK